MIHQWKGFRTIIKKRVEDATIPDGDPYGGGGAVISIESEATLDPPGYSIGFTIRF